MNHEYTEEDLSFQLSLLELMRADDIDVKKLFTFADDNFELLSHGKNLESTLLVQCRIMNHMGEESLGDLDVLMGDLWLKQAGNEDGVMILLQIIYQSIRAVQSKRELNMDGFVVPLLMEFVLTCESKQLRTNALSCLKLYANKFKKYETLKLIWAELLSGSVEKLNAQKVHILVHLFVEFMLVVPNIQQSQPLTEILKKLIVSKERDERKVACFLMKKLAEACAESLKEAQQIQHSWITFISVIENLEENQSHLIIPSLESFRDSAYALKEPWISVLHQQVLQHNNILVIRWGIEYILQDYTIANLDGTVLKQFLESLNNTSLYNIEGYFLYDSHAATFLNSGKYLLEFLETFVTVNWRAVPMHFWLTKLADVIKQNDEAATELSSKDPNCQYIMSVAGKVRVLQNPLIRQEAIQAVLKIFSKTIERMTLSEYVKFIETLYNVQDVYCNIDPFCKKLEQAVALSENIEISKRFYEILSNSLEATSDDLDDVNQFNIFAARILHSLQELPKEKHFWLRFWVVFDLMQYSSSPELKVFCSAKYDLDINDLAEKNLDDINKILTAKLTSEKDEAVFVRQKSVDFFVCLCLKRFDDISSYNMQAEELLAQGGTRTMLKLSELLACHEGDINGETVMDAFLQSLRRCARRENLCYKVVRNLLEYTKKLKMEKVSPSLGDNIIGFDFENIGVCRAVLESNIRLSKDSYIVGLLLGDAKTGDARIEDIYELSLTKQISSYAHIRKYYSRYIDVNMLDHVLKELLHLNNETSRRKPRYFEQSKEHRLKLRIAFELLDGARQERTLNCQDFWNVLLTQNNQLNVTYIYELLTAKYVVDIASVLEKLNEPTKYTASQQVSIISVAHCFCILNWSNTPISRMADIIQSLLPLTMGANFQTRLYSQLTIYSIIKQWPKHSIEISFSDVLRPAIETAIGSQINELMEDARLKLPFLYLKDAEHFYDILMYITAAPYDEYQSNGDYSLYDSSKRLFSKKICTTAKQTATAESLVQHVAKTGISNVQRKMNPTIDILPPSNLISYPNDRRDKEIYVVASLIDKVPNLGGIARTCEVLGIKNLIMDSVKHIEKPDFKNLSMTAEKTLNIIEVKPTALIDFLIQKQAAGFKIVGAEQTVNSTSFVGFQFPQKCVLLMGHEKEGIPADLLGFLDQAVEIPQFGMLRSLNVHVTAALFLWEYCKQHIVERP